MPRPVRRFEKYWPFFIVPSFTTRESGQKPRGLLTSTLSAAFVIASSASAGCLEQDAEAASMAIAMIKVSKRLRVIFMAAKIVKKCNSE